MEKFLVKTDRKKVATDEHAVKVLLKQTTIESLKGVVVIEDIERLKNKLKLKNQSKEIMIESIQELGRKQPPKHVLLSTKIGKVINKLRKNEDLDIAEAATIVYKEWRSHLENNLSKPLIEVKCDPKSEKMRNSGRKFLTDALKTEVTDRLPEAIERECFHQSNRLLNVHYKRTMRAIVFKLKHQESVRNSVLKGDIRVEELVRTNKK
ncbi:transcription elongation factor A N-terminal and central domain-containing protein 2 [Patella vulgata]|uniref:transcription elongation factor A N-terminal and central domain-containing protein 2 n=1 Tax=Patella vulgata TaxID=6465 RepID=UPI0021801081|nr:transcription elongation factor A N-terminal and central domain-containing protein 2 [Patella vulgata]